MKLEGTDAAVNVATVPVKPVEVASESPSRPVSAKTKTLENREMNGGAAAAVKKARNSAEKQPFDKAFQQYAEDEMEKAIREAIERANRVITGSDRKFEISVHEKTKDIMVKVVDTKTNEIIREIPPKKIVDLVVSLCEIAGILFDEKR